MSKQPSHILDTFNSHAEDVSKLASFDDLILKYAISTVGDAHRVAAKHDDDVVEQKLCKTLNQLKQIRQNKSLKSQYQHMFNQCVVLLVAYFTSTLNDLFEYYVTNQPSSTALQYTVNVTFEKLMKRTHLKDGLGRLLVAKEKISFQDMQSTRRDFIKYCGYAPERDVDANTIILGQACRHLFVHAGDNTANVKLVGQVESAQPRKLKQAIDIGDTVQFSPEEILVLHASMATFLANLVSGVEKEEKGD